jgi:hypothetical protein
MKIEIKHRYSGAVLFSLETKSLKLCVQAAIKSRADLSGADLSGANLSRADLSGANLSGADLSGADLYRANLSGANLYRADLSGADLYRADLSGANLYRANLYRADLSGADLSGANLYRANLSGANLYRANLYRANLSGADLSGANLSGADLSGAKDAALILAQQSIVPQEGAFVGWKKLRDNIIARLVIPHDAQRISTLGSRKCRASKAFVYELIPAVGKAGGLHNSKFIYELGKEAIPDSFDGDVRVECSHGIHFFLTREEAEAFGL